MSLLLLFNWSEGAPESPGVPREPLVTRIYDGRQNNAELGFSTRVSALLLSVMAVGHACFPDRVEAVPYRQVEPPPNLLTNTLAEEIVLPSYFFPPLPEEIIVRPYLPQPEIPLNPLGIVPDLGTTVTRLPLVTDVYPRLSLHFDQVSSLTAIWGAGQPNVPLRPTDLPAWDVRPYYHQVEPHLNPQGIAPAVIIPPIKPPDLTDRYGWRSFAQPYHHRQPLAPSVPLPPPGIEGDGPFSLFDWPVPARARDYQYLYLDLPSFLCREIEEVLVAWDDFEDPDAFRYFPQPDQVRNAVVLEGVITELFKIQNVEWPVVTKPSYYEVFVYHNIAIRDQVITPPPLISQTDFPNPASYRWYQQDDFPNLVARDNVVTALYPIRYQDWPNPRLPKWYQQDDPPNLLTNNLKPGPLAFSQKDLTPENPYGYRYFAQPEQQINETVFEIPPAPLLQLPFGLWDWPTPRWPVQPWEIHFISERTDITTALPPLPISLTFRAVPTRIYSGESVTLIWNSINAQSMEAFGGWSGFKSLNNSEDSGPLTTTTTFGLRASSPGYSSVEATVSVTVVERPVTPPDDGGGVTPPIGGVEVRPAGRIVLEPKLAGQVEAVKFDFISSMPRGDTIVAKSVTCRVYSGTDPNAASMVVGTASSSGTTVSQLIGGGIAGVMYDLQCNITTSSGNRLSMAAYLAVTPDRRQNMSGGRRVWIPKKQGETVTVPFDFVSDLQPDETLTSASVTATVYSGVDASPSSIISGVATINGTKVLQNVRAGVVGVQYGLLCRVRTSAGQTLDMTMYCTVQPNLP